MAAFIPQLPMMRPSAGLFTMPSGELTSAQVANAQAILLWLNHLQPKARSSITGSINPATTAALRAFQVQYNAENACRRNPAGAGCHPPYSNSGFQPVSLTVDGVLGPATIQALANYNQSAAAGGYGVGLTQAEIAQGAAVYAAGQNPGAVSMVPIPNGIPASTTPGKTPGAVIGKTPAPSTSPSAPRPSAPAAPVVAGPAPSSSSSVLPYALVGVGVLAVGGALYLRSRRNKRR